MIYALSMLAIFLEFWAAFQLQIITFIPIMGLWSVHKFESKRWVLRFSELVKCPKFEDILGTETIQIIYNRKTEEIRATLKEDSLPLVLQSHWWFAWKEFHPQTEIWWAK